MDASQIRDIANRWFDAFNEHNLEKLLALYHDHAAHFSPKLKVRQPETDGLVTGKAALRAWWADSFERLPTLRYYPTNFIVGDTSIFMEYRREVQGEPHLMVGEVLEMENGKILRSRVYHG